jgi:hypothetical protein
LGRRVAMEIAEGGRGREGTPVGGRGGSELARDVWRPSRLAGEAAVEWEGASAVG